MKKKNYGFTLVEVLVTISILGVISITALPIVRNLQDSLNRQKEKVCLSSIESVAKLYIDSHAIDEFGNQNEGCVELDIDTIYKETSTVDLSECKIDKDKVFVRVTKKNGTYKYETFYAKTPEEEASANKGICTSTIISEGPSIVIDVSNQTKTEKSKTVTVKVNSPIYGFSEDQEFKYKWVKYNTNTVIGSEKTHNFKNNYNDGAQTLSKSFSTPNYNGDLQLIVTPVNISDNIGNNTNKVSKSAKISLDNEAPKISITTKVSTYENFRLSITDNDNIEGYQVSTTNKTPTTWEKTKGKTFFLLTTKAKGKYYVYAKDSAGNISSKEQTVVRMTKPSCSLSVSGPKTGDWYTNTVSVKMNITGRTEQHGLDKNRKATNSVVQMTHSNNTSGITYYGYVKNEEGEAECSTTFKLDRGPSKPKVNLNGYSSGTWTKNNVKMSLSTTSTYKITKWQYSHDAKSWNDDIKNWSATSSNSNKNYNATINWEGNWNFYVRAIDENGIASPASDMFTIKIDKGPSTPNVSCNGYAEGSWARGNVHITATTSSSHNIDHWEYSHSNTGGWNRAIESWSANFWDNKKGMNSFITWDGQWTFYVRAVDTNGIASPASRAFTIRRDTECPTVTPNIRCGAPFASHPNHNAGNYLSFNDSLSGMSTREIWWGDSKFGDNHFHAGNAGIGNGYQDVLGAEGSWAQYRTYTCDVAGNCCWREQRIGYSC